VRRRRGRSGGRRVVLVLLLAGVALAIALLWEGPPIAREVWSLVGVLRVEARAGEIRAAGAESGVDPCLLAAVMYAESRGRPDAVSPRGALGLFQLMPAAAGDAAKRLGLPPPSREELLGDPLLSARLAAAHLAWLARAEGPDLERVLVAYNAGRGKLQRWIKESGSFEAWREERERAGGAGSLAYARSVLAMRERFRERGIVAPSVAPLAGAGGAAGDLETSLPQ